MIRKSLCTALLALSLSAQAGENLVTSGYSDTPLQPGSAPWVTGHRDSTGARVSGNDALKWDVTNWSSCSAPAASCGSTSGSETRSVFCNAYNLDGVTVQEVAVSYCTSVQASIGGMPPASRSCSKYWGACPPPPPPPPPSVVSGGGGGGGCAYSAAVCALYAGIGRPSNQIDAAGAAYWQDQIDSGVFTSAQVEQNVWNGMQDTLGDCSRNGKTGGLC